MLGSDQNGQRKVTPTSTVGRGKSVTISHPPNLFFWQDEWVRVELDDSLHLYAQWPVPTAIISDGGYGVLGFEGDTSDHLELPRWYEPHIEAWSRYSTPATTLWFWNSEIGWAAVHPVLEKHGWRYVNCNIWNKGKGHIAGNVNTSKIRRFPVVTEVCVQYTLEARVNGMTLKTWLLAEWRRSGLPLRAANEACGVKDVAVRKYLDQGHLWYYPPPDMFERMQRYANEHGDSAGRPYFSFNRFEPATANDWAALRSKFRCPHGVTNVWERNPLNGKERVRTDGFGGKAVHLNQKPLDLISRLIEATTDPGDVVWEPFGGLLTGSVAARRLGRRAYAGEIDPTYFHFGIERLKREASQRPLPLSVGVPRGQL
jgi:DNA methylase